VVHQVRLVRKERKEQPVQLALPAQQGHKEQLVQRERQDLPEVEVEHLDRKAQQVQPALLVQQELQVQRAQQVRQVRQVLREQLDPQVQRVQPVQLVLLELLKQFMERSQFQISTEWLVLHRMEQ
jgi:hypothetical protein